MMHQVSMFLNIFPVVFVKLERLYLARLFILRYELLYLGLWPYLQLLG
jgi:hypothetical protein